MGGFDYQKETLNKFLNKIGIGKPIQKINESEIKINLNESNGLESLINNFAKELKTNAEEIGKNIKDENSIYRLIKNYEKKFQQYKNSTSN